VHIISVFIEQNVVEITHFETFY